MHIKSFFTTSSLCFPKEAYTLAGFEPWFSVHQAEAMTTAPQGQSVSF
jgi:hypothetical protein